MSHFKFQVLEMRASTPQEWLRRWAESYDRKVGDDPEYRQLIARCKSFSPDDFREIGKWKDGATGGRYKPNMASVAYPIWEQAANELPKCPEESKVATFLDDWSSRDYTDTLKTGPRTKHFGLSRATALLHFVSGGRYPIFDSRVRTAIARLLDARELANNIGSYLEAYLPLFRELANCCETMADPRSLDKALFSYGDSGRRLYTGLRFRGHRVIAL